MHSVIPKPFGRALIGVLILWVECPVAHAQPLDLDLTFNGSGKVVTNLQLDPHFPHEWARAVAIQSDGKIIAVGTAQNNDKLYDFAVVRYKPDGTIDAATFGTNGRVTTDFGSTNEGAYGVVVQPDGKIVVVGDVVVGDASDFALARYTSGGILDQSFGTNGLVRIDFGAFETASGIALQPDGKIVVAAAHQPNANNSDFLITRFLPNGMLDPSFGDAGKVTTDFGAWDVAWAVAIQGDGKILAVGSTWGPDFQPVHGALARYNPNGTVDQSFRGALGVYCVFLQSCGKIKVNLGGDFYDYPIAVALRKADGSEDGKVVVTGQFGLARFNADGSLDKDFADSGIMNSPDNSGRAVAILQDSRIVVAGELGADFGAAMYEPHGEICSGNGSVATDFNGNTDVAQGIAIQSDGKIVVAGSADNGRIGTLPWRAIKAATAHSRRG